jgi:hypothetical protein
MASLVSAGVSVSVTDSSLYFSTSAPTVPLIFIATRSGKLQADGVTSAAGTLEAGVIREVTSVAESLELYGIPYFWKDASGNEFHGDARNEYGLLALNQFLGLGNRAYVIRADIDTTDESETFISLGVPAVVPGTVEYNGDGDGVLMNITAVDNTVKPQTITITFTTSTTFAVTGSVSGYIGSGVVGTPFTSTKVNFTINAGSTHFAADDAFSFVLAYHPIAGVGNIGNGTMSSLKVDTLAVPETITITFTSGTAFNVSGTVSGVSAPGVVGSPYDNNRVNFTIVAGTTPFNAGDEFTINVASVTIDTPLGANDAAKRVAIVTALQAAINSNQEIRSELYEFNLILCPGYYECADEMVALAADVKYEAFVIADTPVNKTPAQVSEWALTSSRTSSTSVAYYYPWGLCSNYDGRNVVCAPSGIALRTYANSDNQSYVWFAPAGVARGSVTGITSVGYVSGTLGTATTFVETNLNQGQRDSLYESFKNINPIVYFPGQGIIVWGQKTSAAASSALDRVNVVRLLCYLRKALREGAFPFTFEPNDAITRANLKAAADDILNNILSLRGIYEFATKCDESNNTPTRIDNGEMWLDVAIKPTKAAEFIYIPINVVSTGDNITGN